jgi:hypothetical protein
MTHLLQRRAVSPQKFDSYVTKSERALHCTSNMGRVRMWVVKSMKEFEREGKP